jgi:hypothetical protein
MRAEPLGADAVPAPAQAAALGLLARFLGRQAARQRFRGYTVIQIPVALALAAVLVICVLLALSHFAGRF